MGIMSIRLDAETDRRLDEMARRRGQTRSRVVRTAIETLAQQSQGQTTPFGKMAHLIGCVSGGPRDLASHSGERFREMLARRNRRR